MELIRVLRKLIGNPDAEPKTVPKGKELSELYKETKRPSWSIDFHYSGDWNLSNFWFDVFVKEQGLEQFVQEEEVGPEESSITRHLTFTMDGHAVHGWVIKENPLYDEVLGTKRQRERMEEERRASAEPYRADMQILIFFGQQLASVLRLPHEYADPVPIISTAFEHPRKIGQHEPLMRTSIAIEEISVYRTLDLVEIRLSHEPGNSLANLSLPKARAVELIQKLQSALDETS